MSAIHFSESEIRGWAWGFWIKIHPHSNLNIHIYMLCFETAPASKS